MQIQANFKEKRKISERHSAHLAHLIGILMSINESIA
jgi:hypothetical protein